MASPTQSHRGGQRSAEGRQWSPRTRPEVKYASEVLVQQKSDQSDLLDEEALQSDILAGFVRKCHGDDVG